MFLTRKAVNTGWWEIDIHGCYSLVKIAFAPICACKNNQQIWRHNASISRSRDVTDPLRWRHNAKSETTVLGDSCEMSDRWLFLAELCVQGHKIACKKWNNTFVTVNNDFWVTRDAICQWFSRVTSWCDLPMIFTSNFVTRENHWQIASRVTQKSLFTVTHALFFISGTPLTNMD